MMIASDNSPGAFGYSNDNNNKQYSSSKTIKILNNTKFRCSSVILSSNSTNNNSVVPSERWGHTSTIVNDMMYTIGGYTGSKNISNSNWKYLNDINIYSCERALWQNVHVNNKDPATLAPPPSVRSNHASCMVGDRYIVVIAGSGKDRADQETVRYGDMHVLDTYNASFGWLKCDIKSAHGNRALTPRTYHAACTLPGGVVAIFGGYTGTVDVQDVILVSMNQVLQRLNNENVDLHPQVNTVEGALSSVMEPRPFARRFHTLEAMEDGRAGILFGGCAGKKYDCFNDVWVLRHTPKSTNISWTEIHPDGPKPRKRWGHSATVVGLHMVIVGGRSKADMMDCNVLSFTDASLSKAVWIKIELQGTNIPSARRRHTCCLYKEKIILFGGFDGKTFLNDMHSIQLTDEILSGQKNMKSNQTLLKQHTLSSSNQEPVPLKRLSVSEAFAFVDEDHNVNNDDNNNTKSNDNIGLAALKIGNKKQESPPPPPPSNPFVVNHAFPPPPPPSTTASSKKSPNNSNKRFKINNSQKVGVPPNNNNAMLTNAKQIGLNSNIVCKDGYALDGLTKEDRDLVRFFCPYFKFMNYEVIMQQLVRLKAELGEKEMAEQVTQRLLPTAMCLTISKENAVKLIYMLILSEGIYPILSLGLPGHENDLLVKLKTLAKAKGLISETANENLSKEIVDTRSMLEYAANQGWNQVNSEMIQQMMQMGYSENQVYKCYQYVSSFLKKSVELESLLDNIEKASQMEIKQLFHGIILSPSQSSQISRPKSMSVDTGSNNLNAIQKKQSSSYALAQQVREQEIKIDAMEDVLEEVLTCCITQEIMIDPVATKDGNVYERKQIEEWLLKSGGTDPLTRKKVKVSELIPLRNVRDAAEKFRKMQM